MELMFQPLKKYVDFEGRARRSEYWLWALFLFGAGVVFSIIQLIAFGSAAATMNSHANGNTAAMQMGGSVIIVNLVKIVFYLAILLPSIAVAVRRMHDTNRSGWWIMFPFAIFIVALIVYIVVDGANFMASMKGIEGMDKNNSDPAAAFAILGAIFKPLFWIMIPTLVAKLVTFVFRVQEGTSGPNRFGPDPKGHGASASNVF